MKTLYPDNPEDAGEITHFRALTSALSATIGLGNIAGVALAVRMGGPGAILWMMVLAVFGMTAKFCEYTLAQLYRKIDNQGVVSGGPMYYLDVGLKEKGPLWGILGKFLAILFAILLMLAAIGGGNMFQANQSFEGFHSVINQSFLANSGSLSPEAVLNLSYGFGIIMAGLAAAVILGGITRIGAATCRIVPLMCGIYVLASLTIIISNYSQIPDSLMLIIREVFNCTVLAVVVPSRGVYRNRGGARWVAAWKRDSNVMPRRWWRRWVMRTGRPRRAGI